MIYSLSFQKVPGIAKQNAEVAEKRRDFPKAAGFRGVSYSACVLMDS